MAKKPDHVDPPVLAAGQQAGLLVQIGQRHVGRHVGHLHGHDLLRGKFADRSPRSAAGHDVPNVQQQAQVRRRHHVQQQRQGVEIVDELEGLVAAEVLGRLKTDGQADSRRLQGVADILEAVAMELEVLVIRPRVAGRGERGRAARAAQLPPHPRRIPAASSGPSENSRRRCPIPAAAGTCRAIFALSISRRA